MKGLNEGRLPELARQRRMSKAREGGDDIMKSRKVYTVCRFIYRSRVNKDGLRLQGQG